MQPFPILLFTLLAIQSLPALAENFTSIPIPGTEAGVTQQLLRDAYDTCVSSESQGKPGFASLLERLGRSAGLGASEGEAGAVGTGYSVSDEDRDAFELDRTRKVFPFNGTANYRAKQANKAGYDSISFDEVNWSDAGSKWRQCGANCAFDTISFLNAVRKKETPMIRPDRIVLTVESAFNQEIKQIVLLSEEGRVLPVFSYGEIKAEKLYDSFGRVRPVGALVGPVSILAVSDLNQPMRFVNALTGKPTRVQADLREFVSCLKTEVQKAAAKGDVEEGEAAAPEETEKSAE